MATRRADAGNLTVAITGATGQIGGPLLAELQRTEEVGRVRAIGRRAFDPTAVGLSKVSYTRGDVLDRSAVHQLIDGADVVVHLAFIIMGSANESRRVNLDGSRNVFEISRAANVRRLIYTSSVAAYGFDRTDGRPLREEDRALGTEHHYYSAQKAAVEHLLERTLSTSDIDAYILRPCIVGGPEAPLLIDSLPYTQISERLPASVLRLLDGVPILKPVLPDPGVRFQMVHQSDVARAIVAAILHNGRPGIYNLAGPGELTVRELAQELGWYSIPVPELAVQGAAELIGRLGFLPAQMQWISAFGNSLLMDTSKAQRELGWRAQHDAMQTLRETIVAARSEPLIR